jgi:ABC-type glycerol-3-phosphate transport system substrate-binding protein
MSEHKRYTRREFLKAACGTAVASLLTAACGSVGQSTSPNAERGQTQVPAMVGKPFKGVTVRMHAISGANYDELYKLIPEWEEETGAKASLRFTDA